MKAGNFSRIKCGLKAVFICAIAALILLQLGIAGVKLFYDLKYHRPVGLQSYLLFDEIIPRSAPTGLVVAGASWHEKKLVEEAYRSINLPLDGVLDEPIKVVLTDESRPVVDGGTTTSAAGYYNPKNDTVFLVRHSGILPGVDDAEYYRTVLGHEVMHVLDARYLTDSDREEYLKIRGLDGLAWEGNGTPAMGGWALTPGEDFAEVGSSLLVSGKLGGPRTRFATQIDIEAFKEFIQDRIGS